MLPDCAASLQQGLAWEEPDTSDPVLDNPNFCCDVTQLQNLCLLVVRLSTLGTSAPSNPVLKVTQTSWRSVLISAEFCYWLQECVVTELALDKVIFDSEV